MNSKIKFTIKCLLENKLRFILTVLSIAVGVTSVLIVNSVSSFGAKAVTSELDSLGMNGLIVAPDGDGAVLTHNETELLESINGIVKAAPVTVNTTKVYTSAADDATAMIWGIDEKAKDVVAFELMYGRLIDKGDIMSKSKVCILDQSLAKDIFGQENAVGRKLELLCGSGQEIFEVVGVVKTGKGIMQSLMGSYFPAFLYTPYTAFSNNPDFNQIFIKSDGIVSSEELAEEVSNTLAEKANGHYTVTDLAGQKSVLESMLSTVTNVLTIIGAISLLVSGISIMNIMLISVNERTKEIGIKKSIGATSSDIMLDFLAESIIISIIGTFIGICSSSAIVKAAAIILGTDIGIARSAVFMAVVLSVLLGTLFGIIPAYKASKYKPVEALRR